MRGLLPSPFARLLHAGAVVVIGGICTTVSCAPPAHVKVVASQRRSDLTAGGSAQRVGMLRQQQRTQRLIEKQTQSGGFKKK